MQSRARRRPKKALLTRRAKREVQKMNRAEQLRVTDGRTDGRTRTRTRQWRAPQLHSIRSADYCVCLTPGTSLPCRRRRRRRRSAHYSKSGMQSRAPDNNFLERTFLSAKIRVSSSFSRPRPFVRSFVQCSFEITFRVLC